MIFRRLRLALLLLPLSTQAGFLKWVSRDFEVLMNTHGVIAFQGYTHGQNRDQDFFPGYRSDFHTYVDFFVWKGLISNWLIANSTLIGRSKDVVFQLDKIRYTLTPGYRYEFDRWLISGLLLHECIHTISKDEERGSVWWNAFQIGLGSKGAYNLYLVDKFKRHWNDIGGKVDGQINIGAFLHGRESIWLAQNHNYRAEEFGLVRYYVGTWKMWGAYFDVDEHLWVTAEREVQSKVSLTLTWLLTGRWNMASGYYSYVVYDDNEFDNEDGMGALGFKILF